MACRLSEIVVDSRDPEALAAWWAEVLGHRVLGREEGAVEIGPGTGFGGVTPTLVFSPVAEPLPGKPRSGDEGWHVLADSEGNPFCLLRARLDPL